MLRREEHLRLCAETQAKFHAARHECDGVFRVVEDLQNQVVREFGLPIDIGLNALRCAEQWLGNDRAKELSLYRRHNRFVDGPLIVGSSAPLSLVPPLTSLGAGGIAEQPVSPLSLATKQEPGVPCVLVAGSYS